MSLVTPGTMTGFAVLRYCLNFTSNTATAMCLFSRSIALSSMRDCLVSLERVTDIAATARVLNMMLRFLLTQHREQALF